MILAGEIWENQTPKEKIPESLFREETLRHKVLLVDGTLEFLVTENTKGDAETANLSGSRTEEVRWRTSSVLFYVTTIWVRKI